MDDDVNYNDLTLQTDELEALSAIYCSEWKVENVEQRVYSIRIAYGTGSREKAVKLQIKLPPDYPSRSPPVYEISAPWMGRAEKLKMSAELENIYCNHIGESIIYLWIEKVKDFIEHLNQDESSELGREVNVEDQQDSVDDVVDVSLYQAFSDAHLSHVDQPVYHGEPFTEKKSTFQAHLAPVVTIEQVKHVMAELKSSRKIASATHNIMAYRIFIEPSKSFIQDCDDDGETHAGSRLLHLLEILNVQNVVVVVSRWFGGILLGPNRFKYINNAARNILEQCGYLTNQKSEGPSTAKKKH